MLTGLIRIRGPGDLRPDRDRHALVGLDREDDLVGLHADRPRALERQVGHRLERDGDLGQLARQALAGAQVERHPRPAPVGHLEPQRGIGLGARVGMPRPPPRGSPATGLPPTTPGPYCARSAIACTSSTPRRHDRLEHLHLLVAQPVGLERGRRLDRQQRQQLEHVVLDQVAQRAGAFVIAGPALDPDVLRGGDLDVVDVVAVPDRLEQRVGEPQRQQVLDRLLAQVVIDPEDLRLRRRPRAPRRSAAAPRRGRSRTASRSRSGSPRSRVEFSPASPSAPAITGKNCGAVER